MPRHSLSQALMEHIVTRIRRDRLDSWSDRVAAAEAAVKAMWRGDGDRDIELPDGTRTNAVNLCHDLDLWEFVDRPQDYRADNPARSTAILVRSKQVSILAWMAASVWTIAQVLPDVRIHNITTGAIVVLTIYAVSSIYAAANLHLAPKLIQSILSRTSTREMEKLARAIAVGRSLLQVILYAIVLAILARILPDFTITQPQTFFYSAVAIGAIVPALSYRFDSPLQTLLTRSLWQVPLYFILNCGLWLLVPGAFWLASRWFPNLIQVRSLTIIFAAAIVMETASYLYSKITEAIAGTEFHKNLVRNLQARSSLLWTLGTAILLVVVFGIFPAIYWGISILIDGFSLPDYFAYLLAAAIFSIARWPSDILVENVSKEVESYFSPKS